MRAETPPIPEGLEAAISDLVMVAGAAALCADPDEGREHLMEALVEFSDRAPDDYWWFLMLRSVSTFAVELTPDEAFGPGGGPAALVTQRRDGSPVVDIDAEMTTNAARGQLAAMRLVTAAVNGDDDTWMALWHSLAPAAGDDTRFPAAVLTVLEWSGEAIAQHVLSKPTLPGATREARRERERRAS